jgi:hypothetical protein
VLFVEVVALKSSASQALGILLAFLALPNEQEKFLAHARVYLSSICWKHLTPYKFVADSSQPTLSELNSCGICEVNSGVKSNLKKDVTVC